MQIDYFWGLKSTKISSLSIHYSMRETWLEKVNKNEKQVNRSLHRSIPNSTLCIINTAIAQYFFQISWMLHTILIHYHYQNYIIEERILLQKLVNNEAQTFMYSHSSNGNVFCHYNSKNTQIWHEGMLNIYSSMKLQSKCVIKLFVLQNDSRRFISLSTFGFYKNGILSVKLINFKSKPFDKNHVVSF